MSDLDSLQREFFRALMLPLRGSSRESTELAPTAEGHSPEFFRIADELIKPGPSLSAAERLELYHRQYWFRLLDSLAEDFPVLRRMAGDALFWELIESYLLARPSQSYTLRHLGEAFAAFIGQADLLDEMRRTWFYAIATIEYAHMDCFESAQAAVPEAADLSAAVIELQEHVKLLTLAVPADLCWDWADFSPAVTTEPLPIHLAVWREPSGRSNQARICPIELPLLEKLRHGTHLEELFAALPEPVPSEQEISSMFARWHGNNWLGVRGKPGALGLDLSGGWQGMDRMSSQAVKMD